jgi:TPP-dependent pyruvate/acetoin dehydrogenase alpha subunit
VQPLIRNLGSILVAGAKPATSSSSTWPKATADARPRAQHPLRHPARDGFIGQISMLGDMIPVMAGIALAGRMQKKNWSRLRSSATAVLRPARSGKG